MVPYARAVGVTNTNSSVTFATEAFGAPDGRDVVAVMMQHVLDDVLLIARERPIAASFLLSAGTQGAGGR